MAKVWLARAACGRHEDYVTWVIGVGSSFEVARRLCEATEAKDGNGVIEWVNCLLGHTLDGSRHFEDDLRAEYDEPYYYMIDEMEVQN